VKLRQLVLVESDIRILFFNTPPKIRMSFSTPPQFLYRWLNFVSCNRRLGVTVDNHLSFDQHVSDVVRSCNYHIRSLLLIDRETAVNLACSIVASRIDYCDSGLYGVSETNIAKLQQMQNNLARVVCKSPYNTNVTKLLHEVHWFSVWHRITYKVATITYRVRNCEQPGYLLASLISYKSARTLRSSSSDLRIVPHFVKTVTTSHAFRVAASTIWNNLPDCNKVSDSLNLFNLSVV